ncbi:hypothetical protein TNCV_3741941 [Trichonephila clavipes]|nr:hypothetical protein TNCV_3741941 [Trichonephila clavipes]
MLSRLGNAMASFVLTWIRGRPNATVMVVNVTMKREMSLRSVHKMLKTTGNPFHFREDPLRKCFPCAVSAGKKFMARLHFVGGTAEDSTKNITDR